MEVALAVVPVAVVPAVHATKIKIKTESDMEYVFVTGKDGHLFAHTFKNGHPSDILRWNPVVNNSMSVQLLDTEKGFIRDIGIRIFEGMNPELHN